VTTGAIRRARLESTFNNPTPSSLQARGHSYSFIHSYRNRFTWHLVLSELQGHVTMSKKLKRKKVVSKTM